MPQKLIAKSFIDLFVMTKGLMDGNQQPSAKEELERSFPSLCRIGKLSGTSSSVIYSDLAKTALL